MHDRAAGMQSISSVLFDHQIKVVQYEDRLPLSDIRYKSHSLKNQRFSFFKLVKLSSS